MRLPITGIRGLRATIIVTVAFWAAAGMPTVYAISLNDYNSIVRNTPFYDPTASDCTPGQDTSTLNDHTLPAEQGKTGIEQPIDSQGKIIGGPDNGKSVAFAQLAAALSQPYRDYYITMRWNYASWNWDGTSSVVDQKQADWMRQGARLVLVTNPANGKSIVAAALEAGPAPWTGVDNAPDNIPKEGWINPQEGQPLGYTGRVSGITPLGATALSDQNHPVTTNTILDYMWATDQTVTPGPAAPTITSQHNQLCGSGQGLGPGQVVFISQRDKRWDGQDICWDIGKCDTVYNEGCWAASEAMIISTLGNKGDVTPMQVEGSGQPHIDFSSAKLSATYYTMNAADFQKAIQAVKVGALVLVHGHYGLPWYNTSTHYEVMRGVSADGSQVFVDDPWDLPDPSNPSQPSKTVGTIFYDGRQQGTYAHSYGQWPVQDFLSHGLDFTIVTRG